MNMLTDVVAVMLAFMVGVHASERQTLMQSGLQTSIYNLSPHSRSIKPVAVYRTTGNVTALSSAQYDLDTSSNFLLQGPGASVTYDFGQIVAGIPVIDFGNPTCATGACNITGLPSFDCTAPLCEGLGLAYTENALFIGEESDNSTIPNVVNDGTLFLPLIPGRYTVPARWGRGAFRYLTLSLGKGATTVTAVEIRFQEVRYTAAPNLADKELRNYTGYFQSSDSLLNKIWYAGAYTMQLCSIAANTSVNHFDTISGGWAQNSNATNLTSSDVFVADGAKRDRNPWSGDLAVAIKSASMSQNYQNLLAIKNSITEMIILQDPVSGFFPYAGSPLGDLLIQFGDLLNIPAYGSDTYHLWTILGYFEYATTTLDREFAEKHWSSIVRGITVTYQYIDNSTFLYNSTKTLDWGRIGQGGQNTGLNSIYYHLLVTAASFADTMPYTSGVNTTRWVDMASRIKTSVNSILFDDTAGLFFDNTTAAGHDVHPQDGNVLALLYNVASDAQRSQRVAQNLAARLTPNGAPATELPGFVSPFISSLELRAQFLESQGNISNAMNLLRTQWSFMLHQYSNSTLIEGYALHGDLSYGFYGSDYAFISHAHAWSTGPVYSLLHDVVGLQVNDDNHLPVHTNATGESGGDIPSPASPRWIFRPGVVGSNLASAEGGFTLRDGYYQASWKLLRPKTSPCSASSRTVLGAELSTPHGTSGVLVLPTLGMRSGPVIEVTIDDQLVTNYTLMSEPTSWLEVEGISGGYHCITVKY